MITVTRSSHRTRVAARDPQIPSLFALRRKSWSACSLESMSAISALAPAYPPAAADNDDDDDGGGAAASESGTAATW